MCTIMDLLCLRLLPVRCKSLVCCYLADSNPTLSAITLQFLSSKESAWLGCASAQGSVRYRTHTWQIGYLTY
jgi:hypothetical protein